MSSLLIDAKKIIDLQLTAVAPVEMRCASGQATPIVPARQTPCPDGRALSLDGAWQVARWPFAEPETRLVAAGLADTAWETVQQPGKVFYADQEAESVPIANWNRITQTHIDDADGFRVITADTLVFPEVVTKIQDGAMTLGPDAPM